VDLPVLISRPIQNIAADAIKHAGLVSFAAMEPANAAITSGHAATTAWISKPATSTAADVATNAIVHRSV
jgi:hypothetical protein